MKGWATKDKSKLISSEPNHLMSIFKSHSTYSHSIQSNLNWCENDQICLKGGDGELCQNAALTNNKILMRGEDSCQTKDQIHQRLSEQILERAKNQPKTRLSRKYGG